MKYRISDMIKTLDEKCSNQLHEEDYPLDELEVERICHQVLNKSPQKTDRRLKYLKKLLIIVAATICFCTSLWGINQTNLFSSLFKENEENLSESGKVIEINDEHQNIKVTVKGIIGYEKIISLIYEVEKTDGVPFKGNTLSFYSYIEIENEGKSIKYMINDNREVKSEKTPTKRQYVATISNHFENVENLRDDEGEIEVIKLGNVDNFAGRKMKFVVEEVAELYDSKDEPDLDLVAYVKQHPKVTSQPITNENLQLKYCGDSKELETSNMPTHILGNEHLNLMPYNRFPNTTIDNIGFIDGKLHVRTHNMITMWERSYRPHVDSTVARWDGGMLRDGSIKIRICRKKSNGKYKCVSNESYVIEIRDKNGKCIGPEYTSYDMKNYRNKEKYEVYDIKDVEQLSQYKLTARIYHNEKNIQDKWELPFEMNVKNIHKSISYKESIPNLEAKNSWQVNKIDISNIYTSIQLRCIDDSRDDPLIPTPIKIIMKNQAEMILIESRGCSYDYTRENTSNKTLKDYYVYQNRDNNIVNVDGFFIKAIDSSQIESIQIGDVKIPVN